MSSQYEMESCWGPDVWPKNWAFTGTGLLTSTFSDERVKATGRDWRSFFTLNLNDLSQFTLHIYTQLKLMFKIYKYSRPESSLHSRLYMFLQISFDSFDHNWTLFDIDTVPLVSLFSLHGLCVVYSYRGGDPIGDFLHSDPCPPGSWTVKWDRLRAVGSEDPRACLVLNPRTPTISPVVMAAVSRLSLQKGAWGADGPCDDKNKCMWGWLFLYMHGSIGSPPLDLLFCLSFSVGRP